MSIKNISFSLLCALGVSSSAYASDTNPDDSSAGAPRVALQPENRSRSTIVEDLESTYKEYVAPTLKKAEQDVRHEVKPALKAAEKSIKKVFGRKKK